MKNIPLDPVPPPDKIEETVPDLADLIPDRKMRLETIRLLTAEREYAAAESEAKRQRKPVTTKLKSIFGTYKIGLAAWDEWRINYYKTEGRTTLDPDKLTIALLGYGMKADQIQSILSVSSNVGKPSYTLRISKPKQNGEEEGEE
jgi:hypothetical protein